MNTQAIFIPNMIQAFNEPLEWITKAMEGMNDEEIWRKPNENTNSLGVQCQHLSGNIRQYIISGLGGEKDERKRKLEFINSPINTIESPLELLKSTLKQAKEITQSLNEVQLLNQYKVQGVDMSGYEILFHVTQHLYYHAGQIVFLNKLIKNKDLDLYAGRDLNILNEK